MFSHACINSKTNTQMADASPVQPDQCQPTSTPTAIAGHRPRSMKNRRPLFGHLHVQVPAAVGSAAASIFHHPSPMSAANSSSMAAHAADHQPPASSSSSPSLLRSPSAWIRAAGFGGSSSKQHTPRPSKNFCYDARSYAQNFDEGGGAEEDALVRHRCFSPGLPATSPHTVRVDAAGSHGNNRKEAATASCTRDRPSLF
jgi:hypothetical protein